MTDDILDDSDLEALFDSLPSPAGKSSKEMKQKQREDEISELAERIISPWQPTRRLLYTHTVRCQSCGSTFTSPAGPPMTEYSDGKRTHACNAVDDPSLPRETVSLSDEPVPACQHCFGG